jgi:hypothetical protein
VFHAVSLKLKRLNFCMKAEDNTFQQSFWILFVSIKIWNSHLQPPKNELIGLIYSGDTEILFSIMTFGLP